MVKGGDWGNSLGGGRGYSYISKLRETFYQGIRESLTLTTYSIPIQIH